MLTVQEMAPAIRSGLPRNGLVALYDPYRDAYGRNVLHVGNADFATGWTAYNSSTITVTPGQPDPDGGNNAYRIQSSGGTATLKYFLGSTPVATGISYRLCLWAKLLSGNATIKDYVATSRTPTSSWGLLSWSALGDGSSVPLRIYTAAVEDSLDILVYHPQLNLGPTLYPYSAPAGAPGTLQTGVDYSGRGNTLTLGADTNASTDDPSNTGTALSFDGGDYVQVADTAKLVITGPFTLMAVSKSVTGAQEYNRIIGKEGLYMLYWVVSTGYLYFLGNIGGASVDARFSSGSAPREITLNTVNVLSICYDGAAIRGYVNGVLIGSPMAKTGAVKSDTPVPLTIGNRTAGDRGVKGDVYMGGVWERALSGAEQLRAYRYLKSLFAGRGVTVV